MYSGIVHRRIGEVVDEVKNFAVITAKGGNQSLPNKNLLEVGGLPSFLHPARAAERSGVIEKVYVSSEDDRVLDLARESNLAIIKRPGSLAQPLTNHGDVIMHAHDLLREAEGQYDTLTILLGNTVMVRPSDIRRTIEALQENEEATSAMTVWVAQDDHPYRAMRENEEGYLESFLQTGLQDTNRQSYPEVLFYDQGPWSVRSSTLDNASRTLESPGPWWWMGKKSIPLRRPWLTGRDTHSTFDLSAQEWWLSGTHPEPLD